MGSPYRPELEGAQPTDRFFGPTDQFKCAASLVGDLFYQATRRSQLSAAISKNSAPVWSYLFAQPSPVTPALVPFGIYHSSDIPYVYAQPPPADTFADAAYASGATANLTTTQLANARYASSSDLHKTSEMMSSAWIHFANTLDPNGEKVPRWPVNEEEGKRMIPFQGGYNTTVITEDYREAQMDYINGNAPLIHL